MKSSIAIFVFATLGCVGCDQISKDLARSHLSGAATTTLAYGTVELGLVENHGAFMSLGAALPESVRWLAFQVGVPIVLLLLCVTFLRQPTSSRTDSIGLALVVGGGAGNWLDRVLNGGAVTDFVRIGLGPLQTGIFNAADTAVVIGVAWIICSWIRSERSEAA
jgi:signal peptidase II